MENPKKTEKPLDITLKYKIENENIGIREFLIIAINLVKFIGESHKKKTANFYICPQNITLDSSFNIKISSSEENDPLFLYISPEKTGRINRKVDHRSDLYSLGIIFYEMLTEVIPFKSNDPLEVIHAHIAKEPSSFFLTNTGQPLILAEIILKLLKKNPEERYQNFFSLQYDLEKCLSQYLKDGRIDFFALSQKDIPLQAGAVLKFVGREKELEEIRNIFKTVSRNRGKALILISGEPGEGKSRLVEQIIDYITANNGFFLSGKNNKSTAESPYSSITEAFAKYIRLLLSENEQKINTWKEKFISGLGKNTSIIAEILPEFQLIVGQQQLPIQLDLNETKNRFIFSLEKFIEICTSEQPVVLFLDDLQWADTASFLLIKNILSSVLINNLLIIGAYRDNEINEGHALHTIWNFKKIHFGLQPLSKDEVKCLLKNFQHPNLIKNNTIENLAAIIIEKTGGNPFYLYQFLHSLFQLDLIKNENIDPLDFTKIHKLQITDNLINFIISKIEKLKTQIQDVLKLCSCIGNRFDLKILSLVLDESKNAVLYKLMDAIDQGILIIDREDVIFSNDKLHEIIYSLIPENEQKEQHYNISSKLLFKLSENEIHERIFFLMDQINHSLDLIKEEDKERIAQLNYYAGIKAKKSIAYTSALKYFQTGIDLLKTNTWTENYDFTFSIYKEMIEAVYLAGEYTQMEDLINIISDKLHFYDKIEIYIIEIQAYSTQGDHLKVVNIGLTTLKLLGAEFSEKPNKFQIILKFIKVSSLLKRLDPEDILSEEQHIDNPKILYISRILGCIGPSSLFINSNLYALLLLTDLYYGITPKYAFGLIGYCAILSQKGDIEGIIKFGDLAIKMLEKYNLAHLSAKVFSIYNLYVAHLKSHLINSIALVEKGYKLGLENGDLIYSSYCLYFKDSILFKIGNNLENTNSIMSETNKILTVINQSDAIQSQRLCWQTVQNLLGLNKESILLTGNVFNEESIHEWPRGNKILPLSYYYYYKCFLYFLFENSWNEYKELQVLEKYMERRKGTDFYYYSLIWNSLIKLSLFSKLSKSDKRICIREIKLAQKILCPIVKKAPINYSCLYFLVNAELARVMEKNDNAAELYDTSIQLAEENNFIHVNAIAHELAGKFYYSQNKTLIAKAYILNAYKYYNIWGAKAKTRFLENKYQEFNLGKPDMSEYFDMATVIKASQAISQELEYNNVIEKLIKYAIENAGAQNGMLINFNEEDHKLYVELGVDKNGYVRKIHKPIDLYNKIPLSIINYVHKTMESIIIDNVQNDWRFVKDNYIKSNNLKSILTLPIISQGKLTGILYLENNLIYSAFPSDRVKILEMLAAQASISIENAHLIFVEKQKIQLERENIFLSLKREHEEAKYKLLRNRMDPHFLYNILNSINAYIIPNPTLAQKMLMMLAAVYRFITQHSEESIIQFDMEWDFVITYLQLEMMRFGDRIDMDVSRQGDFSNVLIPPFIIQPLIENSFKHGRISERKKAILNLHAESNSFVTIEVADNGTGLNKDIDISQGTLGNIIKRMKYHYNNVELDIHNRAEGGTITMLKFEDKRGNN